MLHLRAMMQALTGATYPYIQYGKPSAATYEFAEQVLKDRVQEIYGEEVEKMPNVYMVGGMSNLCDAQKFAHQGYPR